MARDMWTAILAAIILATAGCPTSLDDDGDDDTGGEDDDSTGDDDTTVPDDDPLSVSPPDGGTLRWDDCISVNFDGDLPAPEELTVTATDDQGADLSPFGGLAGHKAMVMPRRAWPPGGTVALELSWPAGNAIVEYSVDLVVPADPDPVGDGWALDVAYAETCPHFDPLSLAGRFHESQYALVDVLAAGVPGSVEGRVGFAVKGTVDQDPCVPTADAVGTYSDPLLSLPVGSASALFALQDVAARSSWTGVELAAEGDPPLAAATGALFDGDVLDDLMEGDACDLLATLAAPWCGRCPDEPGEECLYLYFRDMPPDDRAAPMEPRTLEEVELDPDCADGPRRPGPGT